MKVTAPLWEMLRNNISSKNRSGEREKAGKDPFPAKHLNLWGGCVTILHIGASCEIGNTDFRLQPKGIFGCICKLTKLSGETPPGKA